MKIRNIDFTIDQIRPVKCQYEHHFDLYEKKTNGKAKWKLRCSGILLEDALNGKSLSSLRGKRVVAQIAYSSMVANKKPNTYPTMPIRHMSIDGVAVISNCIEDWNFMKEKLKKQETKRAAELQKRKIAVYHKINLARQRQKTR